MSSDYRNSPYCPPLTNILEKKQNLQKMILCSHPRQKNMYNKVHDKKLVYFNLFAEIYNKKCCYCGASIQFTDKDLYEIDHYICEELFKGNKVKAGQLSNLVFACYTCNRGKGKFIIRGRYVALLNPDDIYLASVFVRDNKFYIQIASHYKDDPVICNFYKSLKLSYEFRRLDYLLLEMQGFCDQLDNIQHKHSIQASIAKIMQKKNIL